MSVNSFGMVDFSQEPFEMTIAKKHTRKSGYSQTTKKSEEKKPKPKM